MTRPCKGNAGRLVELLTGSLRAKAADRLREHMAGCPGCSAAYERLRRAQELCRSIGEAPAPPLSWRQIEAQVHWKLAQSQPHIQTARPRLARWLPAVGALAAAVVVGAVAGGFLFGGSATRTWRSTEAGISPVGAPLHDEELAAVVTMASGEVSVLSSRGRERVLDPSRPLLQGDRLVTGGTGRVALQWADRTGILLGESSELELRQLRTTASQLVVWQGRIVAHVGRLLPAQRFEVLARGVRAAVKGTHFALATAAEAVEVEVYSGVVEVSRVASGSAPLVVAGGQHLRVPLASGAQPPMARSAPAPAPTLLNLQQWASFQRVMAGTGLLALESTPVGAEVRWDAAQVGTTNLTLRGGLGRHVVELYQDGKLLRRQWVEVQASHGRLALDVRPRVLKPVAAKLPVGFHEFFRHRTVQIQACYERQLKHNPSLEGKLALRVEVDREGRVTRVSLDSDTFLDPKVGQCAVGAVQRWHFPAPGSEVEVVYPFQFRPR